MPPLSPLLDTVSTTLVTFTLPAGKYVIDASVGFRSQTIAGGEASASCDLYAGGVQIDNYFIQFQLDENYQGKVAPLFGWAELPTGGNVEVRCRANYSQEPAGFLSNIGVIESPMVATRVGNLTSV
jgi:hypothetical protein